MTAKQKYHGGLQFNGDASGSLKRSCNVVAATLEDYGHLVERKTLLSQHEASIVTSQYLVRVSLEVQENDQVDRYDRMDRAAGLNTLVRPSVTLPENRLVITICPVSDLLDDSEISELMLVVILYRMVDICSTQRVEWLAPNTVLTVEQFMGAFDSIAPRRQRDHKEIIQTVSGRFAGLELVETDLPESDKPSARPIKLSDDQLLSIAFRTDPEPNLLADTPETQIEDDDRPSDILRLTSWGMTGALASVSMPVAVSMAAVNLIRGEDFRLNTQVLAFSTALFGLNATNAFAEVANAIGL